MNGKSKFASGYTPGSLERVHRTLLLISAKLGDLMEEVIVVGGLVPYLLVNQNPLPGDRRHVGTMDLDLGLSLAIIDDERYKEVSERLRSQGFAPEEKIGGGLRRQTWSHGQGVDKVTVDFLISPNKQGVKPGKLTQIENDFAAITVEGIDLAFATRRQITIRDMLPNGSVLSRQVWVCGPGAFIILKSIAYHLRGENKDAYDLFYVLREVNPEETIKDYGFISKENPTYKKALKYLQDDFVTSNAGRVQVAEFLTGERNEEIEADVLAFVSAFLKSGSTQ